MRANSSPVTSNQNGIHDQLSMLVARHYAHPFRKPVAPWNQAAFDNGMAAWRAAGSRPLILDAGCGVGLSTLHLAGRYPDHFVIGVDQSADRLARNVTWPGALPANQITIRADLVDFWRLLVDAGVRLARHYILYPNPWPKIGQLARRWHGHPVFPSIVALGGKLECRSNWRIYIEEYAAALTQASQLPVTCEVFHTDSPITPFEEKYLCSAHPLWRCRIDLDCAIDTSQAGQHATSIPYPESR